MGSRVYHKGVRKQASERQLSPATEGTHTTPGREAKNVRPCFVVSAMMGPPRAMEAPSAGLIRIRDGSPGRSGKHVG